MKEWLKNLYIFHCDGQDFDFPEEEEEYRRLAKSAGFSSVDLLAADCTQYLRALALRA